MDQFRGAYDESQRLEAALAALKVSAGAARKIDGGSRPIKTRPRAQQQSTRAPHGQNLRRIRAAVEERPGAPAGEIASATAIARSTVATTLGKLVRDGELERTKPPGGGVGFRRARRPDAARAEGGRSID